MKNFLNILLVDDDADDRLLLQEAISSTGHIAHYQFAENGQDGLEKLHDFRPDIIFSDIQMPIMNGKSFLHAVRNQFNDPVPFVMMSSVGEEEHEVLSLGATSFFNKHLHFNELCHLLRQLLHTLESRIA
ncbi:MAG: response regulator [Filimonas sp.]|nr:response regulator [Filimonas sp.]